MRPPAHPTREVCHTSRSRASATRHERAISVVPVPPRRFAPRVLRPSRVRRTCHAGCYVWPGDRPRSPRATSSVVGDVERPRCSDAPGDLAASRLARSPMPTAASGLCHAACLSSKTRTATRHAKPSGSSHAQPWSVMQTVIPRAMKTPRCSRNLLRSQVPRQRPMRNAAKRRVRFLVPCRRGRRPRRRVRAGSAAKRLPWSRATLDTSASSATPFFNPCLGTKCLPQKGVAFGHLNAAHWRLIFTRAIRKGGLPISSDARRLGQQSTGCASGASCQHTLCGVLHCH